MYICVFVYIYIHMHALGALGQTSNASISRACSASQTKIGPTSYFGVYVCTRMILGPFGFA